MVGVLTAEQNSATQILLGHVAHVDAVERHVTLVGVAEAHEQLGELGLASGARAHNLVCSFPTRGPVIVTHGSTRLEPRR
jgi:hypothetical protein